MADKDCELEKSLFDNLQDVLAQLKDAGVSKASFGQVHLEFFPEPVVEPVAAQHTSVPAPKGGYDALFPAGPPSFSVLK